MKPFDWIVLIICGPMFLLNLFGYINASMHPAVQAGLAKPIVKPKDIVFWLIGILFICYRVWG